MLAMICGFPWRFLSAVLLPVLSAVLLPPPTAIADEPPMSEALIDALAEGPFRRPAAPYRLQPRPPHDETE